MLGRRLGLPVQILLPLRAASGRKERLVENRPASRIMRRIPESLCPADLRATLPWGSIRNRCTPASHFGSDIEPSLRDTEQTRFRNQIKAVQ
jgi:hypothetical protein